MSLGHGAAGYSMPDKLAAIAEIGFVGAEVRLSSEDLVDGSLR